METGSGHGIPVVGRFELLRCLLSLGLNDTAVAADGLRPTRMHKLDPLFIKAGSALRAHVLKQHIIPKWRGTDKMFKILGDTTIEDLRLWIDERVAQDGHSPAMPPPP